MNDEQRQQICDNAKYLRQVRPIDPEEIYEYVEGQPHPASVRQVLREEAPDLGLIERTDGRFEPVEEGRLELEFDGVERVPERLVRTIENLLVERYGPGWPDEESGERLRSTIRDFKRRYLDGAPVTYDEETALGYTIYHFPPYFAATGYVFAELAGDGLLPRHLRVLDVGAGVGGPALGMDDLLPDDVLVEYHAVEPSDAAGVLESLLEETGRNFHPTVHRTPIEEFEEVGTRDTASSEDTDPGQFHSTETATDGRAGFDLVLLSNVLTELEDPERVLLSLLDRLKEDGTIVALSPADRNTATRLREIERTIERGTGATIYAPTVRLWPGRQPESRSWSFRKHPDLDVPSFQRQLDEGRRTDDERARESQGNDDRGQDEVSRERSIRSAGSGEFVNVDVQYAYSLVRVDGKQSVTFHPDGARFAPMAEMDDHVTDRIDCVAIKLSHDLSDGGNPLFLVGDGSQQVDHFAVLTGPSALNRDLVAADYGELLLFENVLVLWNDDERAYNLVVDDEVIVDRIPA